MREPLRDRERLAHIIAAADNIARYTEGKSYDDLQANDMMGYAVVYNILGTQRGQEPMCRAPSRHCQGQE